MVVGIDSNFLTVANLINGATYKIPFNKINNIDVKKMGSELILRA